MTLFEPLFLLCVLALLVSLVRLVYLFARHQPARSLALRIAACIGVYLDALITVSVLSPARIYQQGEAQCFDDWCLAVDRVERDGGALRVSLNVISQARRVTQRELGVAVNLTDEHGRV